MAGASEGQIEALCGQAELVSWRPYIEEVPGHGTGHCCRQREQSLLTALAPSAEGCGHSSTGVSRVV